MFSKLVVAAFLLAAPAMAMAADVVDGAGPNLVIDVEGEADGKVVIDLLPDVAPKAVARVVELAREGAYDGVVFHRVIDGFMAQTGDVRFGKNRNDTASAGMGGSSLPNLPAEFSDIGFTRGVVAMARANDPDSANSQFFIMFDDGPFLDGQYTVIGRVIEGMDVVDRIKRGDQKRNGSVQQPDVMKKVTVED